MMRDGPPGADGDKLTSLPVESEETHPRAKGAIEAYQEHRTEYGVESPIRGSSTHVNAGTVLRIGNGSAYDFVGQRSGIAFPEEQEPK